MRRATPRFDASRLGAIGPEHIRKILTAVLPIDGEILYACKASNDPDSIFVIEAAIAMLHEGKRQLWTAMNFSPTYADPFLSRNLYAPAQPDEPVLGLRGFLDAYGYIEETPIVVFLHLISPNLETNKFSKTEINHVPYKQILGETLDQLCTELQEQQDEEELKLEENIYQILSMILRDVRGNERFIPDQLRERVRAHLLKNLLYASWLGRPEASARLQTYITNYLTRNDLFAQVVARPAVGTITIPLHPDRHFALYYRTYLKGYLHKPPCQQNPLCSRTGIRRGCHRQSLAKSLGYGSFASSPGERGLTQCRHSKHLEKWTCCFCLA